MALGLVSVAFPPGATFIARSVVRPCRRGTATCGLAWRLGAHVVPGRLRYVGPDPSWSGARPGSHLRRDRQSSSALVIMDTVTGKWSDYSICSGRVRT
jgi:hypothetical protein